MSEQPDTSTQAARPKLYLIDGSGYIFRAYHALPPLTRKSDGLPVGAVQGFSNMLWKLICEMRGPDAPTHLAVVFDRSEVTFRNRLYPEYKAHRPPAPEDLVPQFPLVREATRAFGVPVLELEGFEADDVIASYAHTAEAEGFDVVVVSSDKDLMQLVTPRISLMDPVRNTLIGREQVIEKFGVGPEKMIDLQALMGDSVDNVPGAPGIGVKTAGQLLEEYGDLDTLLARAHEIKQPKRRETLTQMAEQIRLSRTLVTLVRDAPLPLPLSELTVRDPEPAELAGFLEKMEFRTLARRVGGGPAPAGETGAAAGTAKVPSAPVLDTPRAPQPSRAAAPDTFDTGAYECVTTMERLEHWIAEASAAGTIGFDTETDALSSSHARLCGISLATGPNSACYIPLDHAPSDGLDLGGAEVMVPMDQALAALKPLLEDPAVLKVGQNIKYDLAVMSRYGIRIAPFDDTMLISYVLEAGEHGHGMDELSRLHFDHTPIPFKAVTGTGKAQKSFRHVPLDQATAYAAEDADVTLRLHALLKPRLMRSGLMSVYETLERPLPPVLAAMECAGIRVDPERLRHLSARFGARMGELEARAHEIAGQPFNVASPRQLGEILYDRLGLPGGKRTAQGQWSTDASALEELAAHGHELPRVLLDWRQLAKLKGTYADALLQAADPETSRVHTSFQLAATTTGRLSSSDPNLQNIPIRSEAGREIRQAFTARTGHVLISADYSQIELRILAHMGDIAELKRAFAAGHDIHAATASEMFGVPIEGMPAETRRRAKAINFGIVYGISAFGLANQLGIDQGEAATYIRTYFDRFPGIKAYMDRTRAQVREDGFVTTLFGRRISIPAIRSKSVGERQFAERAAINAPIQGSAADIIRRAMIRMPAALENAGLGARMLLQVHDELVFEAPEAEAEQTVALVREVMERASAPAVSLSVPLVVDARAAPNWDEAH
ncbi:MAG: DNA polymerase I [Brevundimonas sp.]|uniref:DNA polymerase I n=1 Tax=Brevundimonas sp. TaxID=1871086 RepID=UPI00391BA7D3